MNRTNPAAPANLTDASGMAAIPSTAVVIWWDFMMGKFAVKKDGHSRMRVTIP